MPESEEVVRKNVDKRLEAAGWVLQDMEDFNRDAAPGVAVREFQILSRPCDYMLFVDGKVAGVIEAKREGSTLSGFSDQISEIHPASFSAAARKPYAAAAQASLVWWAVQGSNLRPAD